MDSITQGLFGAVAGHAALGKRLGRRAMILGALGGVAPDLDIFIRLHPDPLLGLELHRHFTHALAVIPVGGVLFGLLGWLLLRRRLELRWVIAAATIGYATHAPLDLLTSYGIRCCGPSAMPGWPGTGSPSSTRCSP